jgi:hypothetical protein
LVLSIASWDRFRVPVALDLIDPQCRGHQNTLFRQMLKAFVPPGWVQQVIVVADAGFAANAALRPSTSQRRAAPHSAVPRAAPAGAGWPPAEACG